MATARVRLDAPQTKPEDAMDPSGIIWTMPTQRGRERREAEIAKAAKGIVEAHIKTGADLDQYQARLLDELQEQIELRHSLVADKQDALVKESRLQTKQLEEQLKALSGFNAREEALARLARGGTLGALIGASRATLEKLTTQMEEMDDLPAELFHAREILPEQALLDVLLKMEQDPMAKDRFREEQQSLLGARLKTTGGLGGTHEVERRRRPEPVEIKMSAEEKKRTFLQKKFATLGEELQQTQTELASLGFLQRMFGEQGRFLKMRLSRIKTDQERVREELATIQIRGALDDVKLLARQLR